MTTDSLLYQKIKALLNKSNVLYKELEHEPVFTSEEAAKIRGEKLEQGAKALVLFGDKKPLMIILPGNRKLDFTKVKKLLGIKDLKMASRESVLSLLGVEVGAVPPFGYLEGLPQYVDEALAQNERIAFNPGVHTKSIIMNFSDFSNLTHPTLGDYSVSA